MNADVKRLVELYIAKGEAYERGSIKAGNKLTDTILSLYASLEEANRSEEIIELMRHESPYVRYASAAYSLRFPSFQLEAERTLEDVAKLNKEVGHNAHSCLFAWRNGMLKF